MDRKILSLAVAAALLAPGVAPAQSAAAVYFDAIAANEAGSEAREAAREKARAERERSREEGEKAREVAREAREQSDVWHRWAEDYARDIRSSMGTAFAGRLGAPTVKGAPYSAEVVTESSQTLADGNVISRRTQGAVYRDSEGRVRQESGGDGKARSVFIQDPVEGKTVVITPGSKHAVTTSFPKRMNTYVVNAKDRQVVRVDDTEVRIEDGKVFVNGAETPESAVRMTSKRGNDVRIENGQIMINGKPLQTGKRVTPEGGPGVHEIHAPGNVVVRTIESREGEDGTQREEVRVQVIRGSEMPVPPIPPAPPAPPLPMTGKLAVPLPPMPPALPMPPIPGIQSMRFESTAKLGKGVTANLGMRDIEGVKAEGKSTTWTIPAGEIGNRKPIDVVSESWYSPDLQVTVYSRYNDPRTGETLYRLANLKRAEPSPDLFKVPEDVAVKSKDKRGR